jgi:uncharacterized protein
LVLGTGCSAAVAAPQSGTFGEVLAFRLREIPSIVQLHVCVFPRTIRLFLFGAFAWRSDVLRKPSQMLLFSTAAGCIGLGAVLILLTAADF